MKSLEKKVSSNKKQHVQRPLGKKLRRTEEPQEGQCAGKVEIKEARGEIGSGTALG